MKKIFLLLLACAFAFSGCEKDDICDGSTPTTPRIVIEFYDYSNPAVLKKVTNLKVIGIKEDDPNAEVEEDEGVVLNETAGSLTPYLSNESKIALPLRTAGDRTRYKFILNFGNANEALVLTDLVTFNYTRSEEYVSRACGFKTMFNLNLPTDPSAPIVVNNGNPGNWIKGMEITESKIETENETHVKIFF
ncbi:DUF6452 family protein [Flavobacterium sp. 3HN19-14]|uniref:DUF6452 family protein n=1 Tax=Flavobacterium sp. 3HN19-14 TaxID=3448133 RepID=UPI003EDF6D67